MLGDLLDNRYRIIRTLSKGGFGQTYIAEDTRRPGCPRCVMKHLKPIVLEPMHLENARRLFQTEAIALEKLGHHPQIPRLLAYFEENHDFYLVQDLIRGYPLTKELKAGFQWLEPDIYQLLYDVLSILIFVHDRGVIHRDIKPDNIIRRQLDRTLVLVDFGSVKQIRTHLHPNYETGQTISIGTIGYMSTEQAHGRPRRNSDLYSLGIIGIQAATGIKPKHFQEDGDTGELVWRHQVNLSDGLASFLDNMVAYHFKDRYVDARSALRALKKIQPNSSSRYALRVQDPLDKPSYWSLTASRLASAITSLKPTFHNTPLSQPTFIELPEPTEVSSKEISSQERLQSDGPTPIEESNQTLPMAYAAPLVNLEADTTTADLDLEPVNNANLSRELSHPNHEELSHSLENLADDAVVPSIETIAGEDLALVAIKANQDEEMADAMDIPPILVASNTPSEGAVFFLKSIETSLSVLITENWRHWKWGSSRDKAVSCLSPRSLLNIGGGVVAIALTIWGGHWRYQQVQASRHREAVWQEMKHHQEAGRYIECQQAIQDLKGESETLDSLSYQCAFQGAEQLSESGKWEKAIASANAIPGDAQTYQQAQASIRRWYLFALEAAEKEGNREQAIAIAQTIPASHPLHAEVQLNLFKWQSEEQLWVQCLDLLSQGKWQDAIDRIGPLEQSPYFRDKAKTLQREAALNLQQPHTIEPEVPVTISAPLPIEPPPVAPKTKTKL